jgi:hypothetical protein
MPGTCSTCGRDEINIFSWKNLNKRKPPGNLALGKRITLN